MSRNDNQIQARGNKIPQIEPLVESVLLVNLFFIQAVRNPQGSGVLGGRDRFENMPLPHRIERNVTTATLVRRSRQNIRISRILACDFSAARVNFPFNEHDCYRPLTWHPCPRQGLMAYVRMSAHQGGIMNIGKVPFTLKVLQRGVGSLQSGNPDCGFY